MKKLYTFAIDVFGYTLRRSLSKENCDVLAI